MYRFIFKFSFNETLINSIAAVAMIFFLKRVLLDNVFY